MWPIMHAGMFVHHIAYCYINILLIMGTSERKISYWDYHEVLSWNYIISRFFIILIDDFSFQMGIALKIPSENVNDNRHQKNFFQNAKSLVKHRLDLILFF